MKEFKKLHPDKFSQEKKKDQIPAKPKIKKEEKKDDGPNEKKVDGTDEKMKEMERKNKLLEFEKK